MTLSESITILRSMLDNAESEVKSLESGRKASSARARKSLQAIKTGCHGLRKSITAHTKTLPVNSRRKPIAPTDAAVVAEEEAAEEEAKPKKKPKKKA